MTTSDRDDDRNKKSPERNYLHSLSFNTNHYSKILAILKEHVMVIVGNAHSEMTDDQFEEFINEITPKYVNEIIKLGLNRESTNKEWNDENS